jgi:hypothetical protein
VAVDRKGSASGWRHWNERTGGRIAGKNVEMSIAFAVTGRLYFVTVRFRLGSAESWLSTDCSPGNPQAQASDEATDPANEPLPSHVRRFEPFDGEGDLGPALLTNCSPR